LVYLTSHSLINFFVPIAYPDNNSTNNSRCHLHCLSWCFRKALWLWFPQQLQGGIETIPFSYNVWLRWALGGNHHWVDMINKVVERTINSTQRVDMINKVVEMIINSTDLSNNMTLIQFCFPIIYWELDAKMNIDRCWKNYHSQSPCKPTNGPVGPVGPLGLPRSHILSRAYEDSGNRKCLRWWTPRILLRES
jgi:hypothetical protein